jgi:tartrate dehydrogenase/decarboxylase/D-malate dehydrogenase
MKNVAIIPGDGIGIEVIEGAIKVLKKSEKILSGINLFDFHYFDWGSDYYLKNDEMMPENALDVLSKFDSILLGAVGHPKVPDHITLNGLLLPIRRRFDQYVSVRPCYLWKNTDSVLKNISNLDFVIIRENSEGEYANIGGFLHSSNEFETSIQTAVFTRMGCIRIIEYAFEHAISRNNKLKVTSITKSNAQAFGMVMWDNCFKEVSAKYPNIETESLLVDAACMDLVRRPEDFDVIVASNLFGDILSDLGAGITGGMGIAPSSNINPSKNSLSMFEPVHGSAPDISGKGIANPLAAILSCSMMASYLGYSKIEDIIRKAVQKTINDNIITKDMGGNNSTEEVIKNVVLNIMS